MKKERERRKDKEEGEKQLQRRSRRKKKIFIRLFMVYNNKYGWLADWSKQINSLKKSINESRNQFSCSLHAQISSSDRYI